MKPRAFLAALTAATALAAAPVLAATPVSPGQLASNPQGYDGTRISVTGVVHIRGPVGWAQLCDAAMTCLYLRPAPNYDGRPFDQMEGQRLTLVGTFHAMGLVNHTDVRNVLDVRGG